MARLGRRSLGDRMLAAIVRSAKQDLPRSAKMVSSARRFAYELQNMKPFSKSDECDLMKILNQNF